MSAYKTADRLLLLPEAASNTDEDDEAEDEVFNVIESSTHARYQNV